jgi:transposase-like protein
VPTHDLVSGIRGGTKEWGDFISCFLRYKTIRLIAIHLSYSRPTLMKMSMALRNAMLRDMPDHFSGVVEVDETYIAGTWYNKRWEERKHGTKRGRGTTKQPVFGILERKRSIVRPFLVPNVQKRTLMPIMKQYIVPGSMIYSDAYQLYRETVHEGYRHDFVDHHQNEYARGEVSTNAMEGFWGLLKKRLRSTGGIRRERLHLYVHEEAWRYNNRKLEESAQIQKLLQLLKEFGGKSFT